MKRQDLMRPLAPWICVDIFTRERPRLLPVYLYGLEGKPVVVRVLRGDKMKTVKALMDEFGAALQFSEGFGENWYALRDCLTSLDEWLPGDGYLLVVTKPAEVLSLDTSESLHWLTVTLQEVAEEWSKGICDNGPYNRPPRPFHVILQADEIDMARLRQRFGHLELLEP